MKIRDRIKELRRVKASAILPNPRNWRTHPKAQQDAMRGILAEVGFAAACVAYETPDGLMLIDGHLRTDTVRDEEIPVLVLDVTEDEANKLLLSMDPLSAMAGADSLLLSQLLEAVSVESAAVQKMLDDLSEENGGARNGERDVEDIPEVPSPEDTITQPGDLWVLGEHRLLCGSALSAEDVQRVAPRGWDVAVLDPPYEMDQLPHVSDPCIVFGQAKHIRMIPQNLWRFERVIDKVQGHRSATVQVRHRHAFVAQCGSVKKLPDSSDTYDSIITHDVSGRTDHPHQKPVSLVVEHLSVWTPPWQVVFDPFCGSGTTIMAAEQMEKACVAIEMDPAQCDVIVKRWEQYTGREARREEE